MMKVLSVCWFASLALSTSRADDWLRADVNFIEWDVTTRVALTPERAREFANYKQTFVKDAPAVRAFLQLHRLTPSRDKRQEDARVVIDYIDDTRRYTIYLSRFSLCTADNKAKFAIDDQFRKRVSRLAKQRKTK